MAHGSPRINICHDCEQYTLVPRFNENPDCPICGKETEQTNKEKIRKKYKLGIITYKFVLGFNHWQKIINPF